MVELEPGLPGRIGELRAALAGKDPWLLAARSAAVYTSIEEGTGRFDLAMWGRKVHVSYPVFAVLDEHGQPLDVLSTALLLYYFDRSDGTPIAGRWIAFSELPDGRFYAQAFQGYTGNVLAGVFGDDIDGFSRTAQSLGGEAVQLGEAAFAFRALPQVAVLVVCWLGDEDFPTRFQVLFDASAANHLTTDGCAILGSSLTRRLVKSCRLGDSRAK